MARQVDAATVKSWLSDGREIAFVDVREHGQYGEGHPFFAASIPYSRLEPGLAALVPNIHARLVLLDGGDGTADRAARRAAALGYDAVHVLAGGADAWRNAGYTLFAGVNVPSKTFGELVEMQRHTPRISAQELERLRHSGEPLIIVDGRPFSEFQRMSIPGGICCPNGDLALRIGAIVPDPRTRIVVNCAGRTRSIIGAQTLIDAGISNPVCALENGTQGWFLAGLELERGAKRYDGALRPAAADIAGRAARVRAIAAARGVEIVAPPAVSAWLADTTRTTYILDVRSPEETAKGTAPNAICAPGGQLIQATDQWVGVKGARLVLLDDDGVRAPMVAQWLRQLGHEAFVLDGGVAAAQDLPGPAAAPRLEPPLLRSMTAGEVAAAPERVLLLDLRSSTDFRKGHIAGATWTIRPRLDASLAAGCGRPVVLAGDGSGSAALAAVDLQEAGCSDVRLLEGGPAAWSAAGLPMVATPNEPPDGAAIDFLFFVHDRHDGNAEAARRYLEWETGLLDQLDAQERGVFRVASR